MFYLKPIITTTVFGLAVLGLSGLNPAQADTVADKFATMDANVDGFVTESEFVAYATALGKHTAEEAQAKFGDLSGEDDVLSLEELEAAYAEKEAAAAEETETEDETASTGHGS